MIAYEFCGNILSSLILNKFANYFYLYLMKQYILWFVALFICKVFDVRNALMTHYLFYSNYCQIAFLLFHKEMFVK